MTSDESEIENPGDAGSEACANPETLYVVFHGEFALFDSGEGKDGIVAVAPDMDIHVYSAGAWLGESRVPPGFRLKLKGVVHGCALLNQTPPVTLTYDQAELSLDEQPPYMRIDLPRPDAISSGARVRVDPSKITVESGGTFDLPCDETVALAVIFRYRVEAGKDPRLIVLKGDIMPGYSPNWQPGNTGSSYVLHLFAEADSDPGEKHVRDATVASAALLGVDVIIEVDPSIEDLTGSFIQEREGILADERALGNAYGGLSAPEVSLTLADRARALRELGREFQMEPNCKFAWPTPEKATAGPGATSCGVSVGHRGNRATRD